MAVPNVTAIRTPEGDAKIDYNALANKNHANQHAVGNADAISPELIGASSKSTKTTGTIATNWSGTSAPYTQTLSVTGATANNVIEISLPSNASTQQVAAYQALILQDGGQSVGSITLKAFGTKNTVEIPINIVIRGDL